LDRDAKEEALLRLVVVELYGVVRISSLVMIFELTRLPYQITLDSLM
jgi:hypothetical protein